MDPATFQTKVRHYYRDNRRSFPWRERHDTYSVVISEIMLQQTQTERVVPKFNAFIKRFPDFESLSWADTASVLSLWSGLGYNRRALSLQAIARRVVTEWKGELPCEPDILVTLPSVGPNTAGSIAAFAYNVPAVFIETNIRRALIHEFFPHDEAVHDRQLLPLVEETLDTNKPRDWYYALMDYGAMLGRTLPNPNRRSRHYSRQSAFEGSMRQLRGKIVNILASSPEVTHSDLVALAGVDPERLDDCLRGLERDGFLVRDNDTIALR